MELIVKITEKYWKSMQNTENWKIYTNLKVREQLGNTVIISVQKTSTACYSSERIQLWLCCSRSALLGQFYSNKMGVVLIKWAGPTIIFLVHTSHALFIQPHHSKIPRSTPACACVPSLLILHNIICCTKTKDI